jgi:hypothetical protein
LVDVEQSVGAIKSYVKPDLPPETKDMAFFVRSSVAKIFYMPVQLAVSLI